MNATLGHPAFFAIVTTAPEAVYAVAATRGRCIGAYESDTGTEFGTGSEQLVPATARLVRAVRKHGGAPRDVRWGIFGGMADLADDCGQQLAPRGRVQRI